MFMITNFVAWGVSGILTLVMAGLASRKWGKGEKGDSIVIWLVAGILFSVSGLPIEINTLSRAKVESKGNYYEVLVATPASGGGTLVQARDITGGDRIKVAVLGEYPPKGYTLVEKGGKRFLVPVDVRVAVEKGEYIFATTDGEALIYTPPVDPSSIARKGAGE